MSDNYITCTVKEAVEMVIRRLENIPVPIKEMDVIGVPIRDAIMNLVACVQFWEKEEKEKNKMSAEEEAAEKALDEFQSALDAMENKTNEEPGEAAEEAE